MRWWGWYVELGLTGIEVFGIDELFEREVVEGEEREREKRRKKRKGNWVEDWERFFKIVVF